MPLCSLVHANNLQLWSASIQFIQVQQWQVLGQRNVHRNSSKHFSKHCKIIFHSAIFHCPSVYTKCSSHCFAKIWVNSTALVSLYWPPQAPPAIFWKNYESLQHIEHTDGQWRSGLCCRSVVLWTILSWWWIIFPQWKLPTMGLHSNNLLTYF